MSTPDDPLDPIPAALRHRAPPPLRVRYAQVGQAGPFPLPRKQLVEHWGQPWVEGDMVCFRRVTKASGDDGQVLEDALVVYGPDGLLDAGIYNSEGTLERWDPPQCLLPAEPAPGMRWTATHQRGDRTSERAVELLRCADHPGCLVSQVETRRADGVMVLRMHFAEGVGYNGHEALIQQTGRPSVRSWTESLSVELRTP